MRGRLTEQDLTDYALNELPPDERLYVESMLGISEECRNDVYQMLEIGEMLKEGMERNDSDALTLSAEQRAKVLEVPAWHWRGILQKAAAILMLSAGTAFTATRPGFWDKGGVAADKLALAKQFGEVLKTVGFGAMENPGLVTFSERLLTARREDFTVGYQRSYASTTAC